MLVIPPLDGSHPPVFRLVGELDLATRPLVSDIDCGASEATELVLDLGDLAFLDCCGYGSLVALRQRLALRGCSLTLRSPVGEPARLLAMVDDGDGAPRTEFVADTLAPRPRGPTASPRGCESAELLLRPLAATATNVPR